MTESPQSPGPGARPPGPASPPPSSPQSSPPPQSPPPGQHYGAGPQPQNGMAVAALVLGIVSIVFAFLFFPIGLILGVLGIVFGIIGRNRAQANPAMGRRGMAIAGLITGVIGLVISIVILVLTVVLVNEVGDQLNNLEDFTITQ